MMPAFFCFFFFFHLISALLNAIQQPFITVQTFQMRLRKK